MDKDKQIPKVSIIIPVYNTEKFLEKCIKSVLAQSFTQFECILIDDGSLDNSLLICNEYAEKDSRIKVIRKTNGGVSSARNAGLAAAQGECITFIDSDDWVEDNYLYTLFNNIIKYNCDLSICGFKQLKDNTLLHNTKCESEIILLNNISAKKALFEYKYFGPGILCKLVKRQFIYDNNIKFDTNIKVCEDGLFWFQVINKLQKIVFDSTFCYNYIVHENSITQSSDKYESYKSHFIATRKMLYIEKNKSIIWKIKSSNAQNAGNICISLINSNNKQKELYNFYRYKIFISLFYLLFDSDKDYKYKIITILLLYQKLYLSVKFYYTLYKNTKLNIKKYLKYYLYKMLGSRKLDKITNKD